MSEEFRLSREALESLRELATLRKYGFEVPAPLRSKLARVQQELSELLETVVSGVFSEDFAPLDLLFHFDPAGQSRVELSILQGEVPELPLVDEGSARGPRTRIRIQLPDGEWLQERTAADTMAKFIEWMGVERCYEARGHLPFAPFIGRVEGEWHGERYLEPGYYINVTLSNSDKKKRLDALAQHFAIAAKVEVFEG